MGSYTITQSALPLMEKVEIEAVRIMNGELVV